MAAIAKEVWLQLNRPHGPTKAFMWFTIAFTGTYAYVHHIKPARDQAAWDEMKADIERSGNDGLPRYSAVHWGSLYKSYDDQKGVPRQLANDLTFEQLEGGPSPAYNDMEYMDRNPKAKAAAQ